MTFLMLDHVQSLSLSLWLLLITCSLSIRYLLMDLKAAKEESKYIVDRGNRETAIMRNQIDQQEMAIEMYQERLIQASQLANTYRKEQDELEETVEELIGEVESAQTELSKYQQEHTITPDTLDDLHEQIRAKAETIARLNQVIARQRPIGNFMKTIIDDMLSINSWDESARSPSLCSATYSISSSQDSLRNEDLAHSLEVYRNGRSETRRASLSAQSKASPTKDGYSFEKQVNALSLNDLSNMVILKGSRKLSNYIPMFPRPMSLVELVKAPNDNGNHTNEADGGALGEVKDDVHEKEGEGSGHNAKDEDEDDDDALYGYKY